MLLPDKGDVSRSVNSGGTVVLTGCPHQIGADPGYTLLVPDMGLILVAEIPYRR